MASEKRRKERNLLSGTLLGGQDLLMRDSAKEKALFRDPAGKEEETSYIQRRYKSKKHVVSFFILMFAFILSICLIK